MKEKRVYVVNANNDEINFREREKAGNYEIIMDWAETEGSVYSLKGFQNACNSEELSLENSFILIK